MPRAELLNALIESIGEGLYVNVTAGGAIDFVNRAGLHVLGYDDERELLGRPSRQTIHASAAATSSPLPRGRDARCCGTRETGESVEVEERLVSVRRDRLDGAGRVLPLRRSRRRTGAAPSSCSATPRSVVHAGGSLEAADAERRRLGRDLHDGAQQRLVNVVIALQMATGCVGTRCVGPGAGRRTRAAIEDLRELGAGLHPSILTKHAACAVRSPRSPARAPLPVTFDVPDVRLDASIEAACYFFVVGRGA